MIRLRLATHESLPWWEATLACVLLYLAVIAFAAFRIRGRHRETFDRLGGFAFLDRGSEDRFKLAKYTLLSNAHWELGDWLLNAAVMTARILGVAFVVLFAWPVLRSIMT